VSEVAMRTLVEIQYDIGNAKKRLAQLRAEEYQILLKYPCRGCKQPAGRACVKICSRAKTAAHAERHKDAREALAEGQKKRL
jgi:hypothetical protein